MLLSHLFYSTVFLTSQRSYRLNHPRLVIKNTRLLPSNQFTFVLKALPMLKTSWGNIWIEVLFWKELTNNEDIIQNRKKENPNININIIIILNWQSSKNEKKIKKLLITTKASNNTGLLCEHWGLVSFL